MAGIANDPGGRKRILFFNKQGSRKAIWLGKISRRLAEEIKTKVESINAAAIAGCSLDGETAAWLGKIGDYLHAKLAVAGLVTPRQTATAAKRLELAAFLDSYIAGRTDVKPNTHLNLKQCRDQLVKYFGADRAINGITVADAKLWEIWLKEEQYSRATISRNIGRAKQFFQSAIDGELIVKNPFDKLKPGSQVNEDRQHFVSLEVAYKILEACPDAEWRLLFALSRFGGLRCPSEHLALTWADIDWERGRFKVNSPKTEHHEGKAFRWVPIFPELRPYLEEAFELAPEGTVHVIRRYRDPNANLRTQLLRIIKRAGVDPWEKPFQNLRSTRETELCLSFPLHVACAWIGNTKAIAAKHYLQVTDADFERAAVSAPDSTQAQRMSANGSTAPRCTTGARHEKSLEICGDLSEYAGFSAAEEYPMPESNWPASLRRTGA